MDRLTNTEVSIDTGITSGTSQVLVLTVRDMKVSLGVTVLLGQSEVDDINLVASLANTHQEVVRLDITVDERFGVDVLDAGDKLICEEQDSLEGELAIAEVEKILQARSEEIKHHGIIVTLGSKPADEGNPDTSSEGLVDTSLIFELRVLGLDTFELDGNLFARDDVGT